MRHGYGVGGTDDCQINSRVENVMFCETHRWNRAHATADCPAKQPEGDKMLNLTLTGLLHEMKTKRLLVVERHSILGTPNAPRRRSYTNKRLSMPKPDFGESGSPTKKRRSVLQYSLCELGVGGNNTIVARSSSAAFESGVIFNHI